MKYRRIHEPGASYFFTVVTYRRHPLFADPAAVALLQRCINAVKRNHPFTVDAFVILPDHLHMLWTLPPDDAAYPIRWQLIKTMFTRGYLKAHPAPHTVPKRSLSRVAKREQAVWQRRYWEHLIGNDDDFAAHVDYIHLNPVEHGLASLPRDWPPSSFPQWVTTGTYAQNWGPDTQPDLPAWATEWR